MASFRIDGIRMAVKVEDIDGDGVNNEIESVSSHKKDSDIMRFKETSELGEALEIQNKDSESNDRMSSVDFISRINGYQHAPITAIEFISSAGVISGDARKITRILKRNAVSIDGKGRAEFVDVVVGKKESDIRKSGVQNMAGSNQSR